jgi:hypothetical protein
MNTTTPTKTHLLSLADENIAIYTTPKATP